MEIMKKGLEYIEQGLSIHLLYPMQKNPIEKGWSSVDNLTAREFVEELKEHNNANIGVRLGNFSKIGEYFLYVLDLDISSDDANDIEAAYNALESVYKNYNQLPCVKSASKNSRHFYFLSKLVLENKKIITSKAKMQKLVNGEMKNKNTWEIDLMATGKQVVIPPSVFNGNTYQWDRNLIEYIKDESKKALMIINDKSLLNIGIDEKKEIKEPVAPINLTLSEIKDALSQLETEWLDNYDKWLSIGMALHHEYADTDKEQEALALYEEWSKTHDKYEKGGCFKKWKSFSKKENGITLGTLLYTVKPKTENKLASFSKFLNETKLDLDNLKEKIKELNLSEIECELFIDDIAKSLSVSFGKKIDKPQTRKFLSAFKKEAKQEAWEAQEKLTIGLDDALAKLVLSKRFNDGKYLLNQNNNIFHYKRGAWRLMEQAYLGKIVYEAIADIMISEDKQYETIKKVIYKKKKQDDMNGLTNQIVSTILKLCTAPTDEDILNLQHKKDMRYSVINTLNKEIYIQNGEVTVSPHKYDSYLLTQLNVEYDPNADCPNFMLVLNNVFQDLADKQDVIRHFLECLGQVIQTKKNIPMFMLLLGGGENGKSFTMKMFLKMLGIDNAISTSITKFTSNPHGEAELLGKLCFYDDDFKKGDILDDSFLKKTSETAAITGNPKFKNQITFYSICNSIINANNPPKTKDVSHGMKRRAQCFPFIHQFTNEEKDYTLEDKIALERAGILNVLIKHYIQLQKRGHFLVPLSCQQATNKWINSSNPLNGFLDEQIVITGDSKDQIKGQAFYELYVRYIDSEGSNHRLTRNNFYDEITSADKRIIKITNSSDKNIYITGVRKLKF